MEAFEVPSLEVRRCRERLQNRQGCLDLKVDRLGQRSHRVMHAPVQDVALLLEIPADGDDCEDQQGRDCDEDERDEVSPEPQRRNSLRPNLTRANYRTP
jgi:hypothetical protein